MWIKRLYIGDFGILRNQTLDDIKPGIVVVGGRNRSGKSTFMKVLRYLCSGFPRSGQIPPAKTTYRVEADIVPDGSKDLCRLRLEGHSAPVLFSDFDKKYAIGDLYPDEFTYRHLYTIILDQLTALPTDLEGKDGIRQLQSALLGAGLSDIAGIPRLEEMFLSRANDIGGKDGKPTVKKLKSYSAQIDEGRRRKAEALKQVDAYRVERQTLEELEMENRSLGESIRLSEARCEVLECLVNTFDDIQRIKDLTAGLDHHPGGGIPDDLPWENSITVKEYFDEYKGISDKRDSMLTVIKSELDEGMDAGSTVDLLLGLRDRLSEAYRRLPMIDERLVGLAELKKEAANEKSAIILQLENLGLAPSDAEFSRIEGLTLDPARESELMKLADRAKQISEEERGLHLELDQYTREQGKCQKELDRLSALAGPASIRPYVAAMIASAIAGIGLSLLYWPIGLIVGIGGIAVALLLTLSRGQAGKEVLIRQEQAKAELDDINDRLAETKRRIDELQAESSEIEDRLEGIRKELGIAGDLSPDMTLDCFRRLMEVKVRLLKYKGSLERINGLERSILDEAGKITGLLDTISPASPDGITGTGIGGAEPFELDLSDWDRIRHRTEKWHSLLEKALELNKLNISMSEIKAKLLDLMGPGFEVEPLSAAVSSFLEKSEYVREYKYLVREKDELSRAVQRAAGAERLRSAAELAGYIKNGSVTEYLFEWHDSFGSRDSARDSLAAARQELDAMKAGQLDLVKQIQSANDRLKALALTDKLEEAHRMIAKGQAGLRPLAYKYAVNKAAAILCSEIKQTFLKKMGEELLSSARDILFELTGGEYAEIAPCEDLSSIDYSFRLDDGTRQDSVSILSRGTQEQVFLAVRLGRIKDSKPAPVIIDDSFVNFDARHLRNAVRILRRLSETHQIFVMTCHPHMVQLLEDEAGDCQYWKLERGVFTLSDAERLYDHLKPPLIL